MKLTTFGLSILLMCFAQSGWSQDDLLQQEIGITILDQPVKEALGQIEKALNITLAYPSSLYLQIHFAR